MKEATKQYLLFLLLGFGSYITYFCLLAQTNYWTFFYDGQILTIINTIYCIAEMVGSFIIIPIEKKFSAKFFASLLLGVSATSLIVIIPLKFISNMTARFVLTMIPVACSGCIGAMFYPVLIAMSSKLSSVLATALQIGNGICAISFQVLEDIISIFVPEVEDRKIYERNLVLNAAIYYAIAIIVLLSCFFLFIKVEKIYPQCKIEARKNHNVKMVDQVLPEIKEAEITNQPTDQQNNDMLQGDTVVDAAPKLATNKKSVLSRVWFFGFSCGVSYAFSAAMFPLFVIQVPNWHLMQTQGKKTNDMLNLLVLTVNIFCDFMGRIIAAIKWIRKLNIKFVMVLCYIRVALVVMFVLFNFPLVGESTKPIICSDALFYTTLILFSTTTTMVSTSGYMRYQELVETDAEKSQGSYIVNLFMQSGLFVGGIATLGMIKLFK